MSDDGELRAFRKVVDQLRVFQGVRSTERKWRDLDELNDAKQVLESAGIPFTGLRHRGLGQDPPDCEAWIDGQRCGIEVTEFMHERSLGKSIRAIKTGEGHVHYHEWTRDDFLQQLRRQLEEKDNPADLKGGPYPYRYFLVLWTSEMHLPQHVLEEFLEHETFLCSLITDAYFLLPYHPEAEVRYPVVPLTVVRRQER